MTPKNGDAGRTAGSGLAVASLVLGILGVLTGVVVVGGILGVVGSVLGFQHLRRGGELRVGMAKTGVALSLAAVVMSGVVLWIGFSLARDARAQMRGFKPPAVLEATGKPAADFAVTTTAGDVVRISELKGRRVVIHFWASWLPASVRQVPDFVRLRREIPEEELAILAISGEESRALETFLREHEVNYAVARSARGVLPEPYSQIDKLPTTFFLDRDGVIDHVSVGPRDYQQLKARAQGLKPESGRGDGPRRRG